MAFHRESAPQGTMAFVVAAAAAGVDDGDANSVSFCGRALLSQ